MARTKKEQKARIKLERAAPPALTLPNTAPALLADASRVRDLEAQLKVAEQALLNLQRGTATHSRIQPYRMECLHQITNDALKALGWPK